VCVCANCLCNNSDIRFFSFFLVWSYLRFLARVVNVLSDSLLSCLVTISSNSYGEIVLNQLLLVEGKKNKEFLVITRCSVHNSPRTFFASTLPHLVSYFFLFLQLFSPSSSSPLTGYFRRNS